MPEEKIVIENPRYRVEKASPYGYSIVDSTGQDKPHVISLARDTVSELAEINERLAHDPFYGYDDYDLALVSNFKLIDGKHVHVHDPAYMDKDALERMEEHDRKTAQGWCETWNLVEAGYCGSCKKKFAEGEQKHSAVGFHELDKIVCFACACSQED